MSPSRWFGWGSDTNLHSYLKKYPPFDFRVSKSQLSALSLGDVEALFSTISCFQRNTETVLQECCSIKDPPEGLTLGKKLTLGINRTLWLPSTLASFNYVDLYMRSTATEAPKYFTIQVTLRSDPTYMYSLNCPRTMDRRSVQCKQYSTH